jgi:hypothetical protein
VHSEEASQTRSFIFPCLSRLSFVLSIFAMAPAVKETSVDLCKRVNGQGNTIAIRMLEYLSTAKTPINGFEALAREFIELCQVRRIQYCLPEPKLTFTVRYYGPSKPVSPRPPRPVLGSRLKYLRNSTDVSVRSAKSLPF